MFKQKKQNNWKWFQNQVSGNKNRKKLGIFQQTIFNAECMHLEDERAQSHLKSSYSLKPDKAKFIQEESGN